MRAFLLTLLLVCCFVALIRAEGGRPVSVVFGNTPSEAAAGCLAQNSTPGTNPGGLSFRRLDKGGRLTFELACAPDQQNYLTVRFNGSEANPNYLYLVQPDGANDVLNPAPQTAWDALDHDSTQPPFPGRYYYSTYIVPVALTKGRSSVRLTLESRGSFSYYGGHVQEEQKSPSKAVYLAAVGTDPCYREKGDEALGEVPTTVAPAAVVDDAAAIRYLQQATLQAVERLMTNQLYGESFKKARAFSPGFSSMLEGAIVTAQDVRTATTDGRWKGREQWTEEQWLASFVEPAIQRQNWCPMMGVEILANTYIHPWAGTDQRSPQILDRLFKALDFWCLAQGSGGEFAVPDSGPGKGQWIGAKTDHTGGRKEGYNWDLQANGVPSLATGFIAVYNDITSRKDPAEMQRLFAALDEEVDNNHDGKMTTRRAALARLYGRSRQFFASKDGVDYYDPAHRNPTPSQGFNLGTLYSLNRALKLLDDSLAFSPAGQSLPAEFATWPTRDATDRLPRMLLNRFGRMADGERWFSAQREGISYEGGASSGGYDGNYGVGMQGGLESLARLTEGDPLMHDAVVAKLAELAAGYGHFYRPQTLADARILTTDYIVSARNIYNSVRPAADFFPYAALNLHDPSARREAWWFSREGRALQVKAEGGFVYYDLLKLQSLANFYAAVQARNAAEPPPPLPMEDGAPDFVWSDLDAQCVVFKNRGERFYLAFNWHRPRWEINDLARIHWLGPKVRRVANVRNTHQGGVEFAPASAQDPRSLTPSGHYYDFHAYEMMNEVRFGPYVITQNLSSSKTFDLSVPGNHHAKDLATGQVDTHFPLAVKPRTTVVLEILD